MTTEDRINALAELGFTARQARFLFTVMLHAVIERSPRRAANGCTNVG